MQLLKTGSRSTLEFESQYFFFAACPFLRKKSNGGGGNLFCHITSYIFLVNRNASCNFMAVLITFPGRWRNPRYYAVAALSYKIQLIIIYISQTVTAMW
jgi:hypothetical protein